jgi:hypothetical protein
MRTTNAWSQQGLHDVDAQQKMRGIAESYEKLARRLEQASGGADKN